VCFWGGCCYTTVCRGKSVAIDVFLEDIRMAAGNMLVARTRAPSPPRSLCNGPTSWSEQSSTPITLPPLASALPLLNPIPLYTPRSQTDPLHHPRTKAAKASTPDPLAQTPRRAAEPSPDGTAVHHIFACLRYWRSVV
jgi:hypothetical protein